MSTNRKNFQRNLILPEKMIFLIMMKKADKKTKFIPIINIKSQQKVILIQVEVLTTSRIEKS